MDILAHAEQKSKLAAFPHRSNNKGNLGRLMEHYVFAKYSQFKKIGSIFLLHTIR